MKFNRCLFVLIFLCCAGLTLQAQGPGQHRSKTMRRLQKTVWVAAVSGIVIDDDARAFKDLFDVENTWSYLYFPSRISLDGYRRRGITFGGDLAYGQLKKGKSQGDLLRPSTVHLITTDVQTGFFIREIRRGLCAFSPYFPAGLGYTFRTVGSRKHAVTLNTGIGINIWLQNGFGIQLQSLAKFSINGATGRNYLQHSVGMTYCFSMLTGAKVPMGMQRRGFY